MTRIIESPRKPRVGITIGDPTGIGPEVVLKAVSASQVGEVCRPVIIADARELQRQASHLGLECDFEIVPENGLASPDPRGALILDTASLSSPLEWGRPQAAAGRAAISFIEAGVRLCLSGDLDALATAPVNKEALKLAGSPFPGHTEMLAALCGTRQSLMAFFAGDLRVALLTIHVSLAEAISLIKRGRVIETILLAERELQRFGIKRPRIAVAGLNPHAGERGLFGNEEIEEIAPAVEACAAKHGVEVSGPFPADTLFVRAARGEFDLVIGCYHDQALIAVKCLAFGEAVNVTLGLPIIRTSVDHGTAFDIAGRGVADAGSMAEAIMLAAKLAKTVRRTTL